MMSGYMYWDVNGRRVHYWGGCDKWAVGHGPIEYIAREEALAIIATVGPSPLAAALPLIRDLNDYAESVEQNFFGR